MSDVINVLKAEHNCSSNVCCNIKSKDLSNKILELSYLAYTLKRDAMKPCCVKIKDELLFDAVKVEFELNKLVQRLSYLNNKKVKKK
jgi:hypothetical protein